MYSEIAAWGQLRRSNRGRDGGIRAVWELVNLPLQGDQGKKLFQPDVSVGRNRIPWKNPEQIFFSVEPDAKFAEVRGETPVNLKSQ